MANTRAAIHCVDIATPDLTIGGLTAARVSPGIRDEIIRAGGYADRTIAYEAARKPVIGITTYDLTALGSIGIAGAECTTVDTYWHKKKSYTDRETGSNHVKLSLAKAYGVPRSLSFSRGQLAALMIDFLGMSSDGTTAILSRTDSQALVSGWAADYCYQVAKIVQDGDTYECDDGQLSFGLDARTDGMNVYDTEAWIESRDPVLSFNTPDIAAELITSGVGSIWLRRRQSGTVFYADAVSQHVSISWYASKATPGDSGGGEAVSVPVFITPLWDGNAEHPILTISTAVAIT